MKDDKYSIDLLAEMFFSDNSKRYRIQITESWTDESPEHDYTVELCRKDQLSLENDYSNWRRIRSEEFDSVKPLEFEVHLQNFLEENLPESFEEINVLR